MTDSPRRAHAEDHSSALEDSRNAKSSSPSPPLTVSTAPTVGSAFCIPKGYEFVRMIGSGAYGSVASIRSRVTGETFAVKKVSNAYNDLVDAKRILREIRILRHIRHPNVLSLIDIFPPLAPDSEDVYLLTDFMEADLHKVIYSKQRLGEEHAQYFVYQVLRGLQYLHRAGIVHRDLKPSNLLVNKNCDLKICDFGLARGRSSEREIDKKLTDYVVTRWYRAPEVVLNASKYDHAVDVWAVGCIFAELIGRKALFNGSDHLDQIRQIVSVLGVPEDYEMSWIPKGASTKFLKKLAAEIDDGLIEKRSLEGMYLDVSAKAIDLMTRMLQFDPAKRISVDDALAHPYFSEFRWSGEAMGPPKQLNWEFDAFTPTKRIVQSFIYCQAAACHPEIIERDGHLLSSYGIKVVRHHGPQIADGCNICIGHPFATKAGHYCLTVAVPPGLSRLCPPPANLPAETPSPTRCRVLPRGQHAASLSALPDPSSRGSPPAPSHRTKAPSHQGRSHFVPPAQTNGSRLVPRRNAKSVAGSASGRMSMSTAASINEDEGLPSARNKSSTSFASPEGVMPSSTLVGSTAVGGAGGTFRGR